MADRQRTAANVQAGLLRRFASEIVAEHGPLPPEELDRRAHSMLTAQMQRLALHSAEARRAAR